MSARAWIDGLPIDGYFTVEVAHGGVVTNHFTDATFAPADVVRPTLEASVALENDELWKRLNSPGAVAGEITIETHEPYSGPRPRFALWGTRHGDVQVGSLDDARWQARLRGTDVRLSIPHVRLSADLPLRAKAAA